jgi:hypothetical protein
MLLVQLFDQGIWFAQELVHEEDLKALEDVYAKQGYEILYERVASRVLTTGRT